MQKKRDPGPAPQVVKYLNLQDLQRNLPKEVGLPWCVTENSADTIKLAVVKYGSVHMEVVVRSVAGSLSDSLLASVFVQGIPAPKLDNTLETVKLRTFLNDLLTLPLCCGVTDGDLQSLAEFPDGTTGRSYCRYVHHDVTHDTATVTHKSCVRAKLCELVLLGLSAFVYSDKVDDPGSFRIPVSLSIS